MTYDQTLALLGAMDTIEVYAKMYQSAMSEDDTDWKSVDRYNDNIAAARKAIFNLLGGSND